MIAYRDSAVSLAARCVAVTLAAFAVLPAASFVIVAAALVARFNQRATALADLSLASSLGRSPLGLGRPDDDAERLLRAFTTLLDSIEDDEPEVARAKVDRLARSEPLSSGRRAYARAMREHRVVGWTRKTGPDPCELCGWLANGRVFAPEHPFYQHPSCSCQPVPVVERTSVDAELPRSETVTTRTFRTGSGYATKTYRSPTPGLVFITSGQEGPP